MSFNYLTESNIKQAWEDSRSYMKPFFDPLAEYERIARNRPHPKIDAAYPKNTDGTLAAIIKELPKRIIQQEPTGVVKSNDNRKYLPIVANWRLQNEILPRSKANGTVRQKSVLQVQKALTFGSNTSMTFWGKTKKGYGADFRLVYVKDMFFQKGKLSWDDSDIGFLRAWYQESDLEAIIAGEDDKEKKAKKNKDPYTEGWRREILRDALKQCRDKTTDEKSGGETDRNAETGGIEIIHAFQEGIGAKFYSYLPSIDKICRVWDNPDPRGRMPIQRMYKELDMENPLGSGSVELSGGMQNFLDSGLQMYQYNAGLMLNPPIKTQGTGIVKQSIKYKNGAIWNLGTNPEASVEVVNINTTALSNFSNIYGLAKSQILNLNNSTDTSVSQEVGNPGFSKTDAGVNALQAKLGISDNDIRKQFESWFGDVCESLVNLDFAMRSGSDELQLDRETADQLRALTDPISMKYVAKNLTDEDVFTIDYDKIKDVEFEFVVDASTSKMKDDAAQLEALDGLLERAQNPILQSVITPDKIAGVWNSIVSASGVEDPEKISIDLEELQQQMQQQEAMAQQQAAMQPQPGMEQQMPQEMPGEAPIDPTTGLPVDPAMQGAQQLYPEQELPQEQAQDIGPELPVEGQEMQMQDVSNFDQTPETPLTDEDVVAYLDQSPEQSDLSDEEIVQFVEGLRERGFPDDVIENAVIMLEQGMPEEEVLGVLEQFLANQGGGE